VEEAGSRGQRAEGREQRAESRGQRAGTFFLNNVA